MPWRIAERDGQYCVVLESNDRVVKCHETRDAALAHMRALYASEKSVEMQGSVAEELGVTMPMYVAVPGYLWAQKDPPRVKLLDDNNAEDVAVVLYAGAEDGKLAGIEHLVVQELGVDTDEAKRRADEIIARLMKAKA